jgi:hypothetical protein
LIKANGKQRALDIFKEFYDVPLADLAQHSLTFWSDASNHAAILNYKSSSYGKQALAQLLLASMDTSTSSSISLKVSNPVLHNDGPYIWISYIQEVFPSKLLLTKTITNNITTLTLRSFNHDLGKYVTRLDHFTGFLPDDHCMDTCLEAFFREMNTHPNETVKSHFTRESVAYYNSTGYRPDINSLLSQAKELHRTLSNHLLPYNAPSPTPTSGSSTTSTDKPTILAMIANVLHQQQSQLENLQRQQHCFNRPTPSWFTQCPDNVREPKYHNGKCYYWCEPCGRYSNTHATEAIRDFRGHDPNFRPQRCQDQQQYQQTRNQHQQQQDRNTTASGHSSQASSDNNNQPRSFQAQLQDLNLVKNLLRNCGRAHEATQHLQQLNNRSDS